MIADELNALRGRVQALELLATSLLANQIASRYADPVKAVDEIEREIFASLQMMERTTDPDSDAAWAEMADALRRVLGNTRDRLGSGA